MNFPMNAFRDQKKTIFRIDGEVNLYSQMHF